MRMLRGKVEILVQKIRWPFPERVHAVTLWPFIFYEAQVWDDKCVQVHERYHRLDQIRWGIVRWFTAYLILLPLHGGGRRHPLEREAYRR